MIPQIHSRSRAADISATATSIFLDFSKRDFSADTYMTFQIGVLKERNTLMSQVLNEKLANSILAPIDDKRDNNLRAIYHEVDAKQLWTNAAISEAAALVAEELDKYGFEIIDLAYATESAHINALLQDLTKRNVAKAIPTLPGLRDLILELEASQKEFETAYLQVVDMKIAKEKLISATKLGKVIREHINEEIMGYLKGMAKSTPEPYKDCAKVIGEVIANNNKKVRSRMKQSGEDQPPEE